MVASHALIPNGIIGIAVQEVVFDFWKWRALAEHPLCCCWVSEIRNATFNLKNTDNTSCSFTDLAALLKNLLTAMLI